MKKLQSVRIENFKCISDAPFDLGDLNVLVGSNNSGKSSVIQAVHFGVGLLQTIGLAGRFPASSNELRTSLNPNQLIYSPSEHIYSLGADGKLLADVEQAIVITYSLASGDECSVRVRRGRNRNIVVAVQEAQVARQLSKLEHPFSVFSPGLAGIAKNETYVSDGVLLRTIARGDANLVLRNILCRLWGTDAWDGFMGDLHDIFPDLAFRVDFNDETDEFISAEVKAGQEWIPLELAGTGVLQATQILSYIHRFSPTITVLDEPDSHLHPNNQRLLCSLLRKVAEERGTQVLLTTHSRHVIDAIAPHTRYLWVRAGTVDAATEDDEIGILLDIGALDVKERVSQQGTDAVVLTEDENTSSLEAILEASGFVMEKTAVVPYYGCSTIKQLRPLVRVIRSSSSRAKILVHRDRDYWTEEESQAWSKSVKQLRVQPFLSDAVHIENAFLDAQHLAELNTQLSADDFEALLRDATSDAEKESIQKYVNGRIDVERKKGTYATLNHGELATEATDALRSNPERFRYGRAVLRALRRRFRDACGENLRVIHSTQHLASSTLQGVARKAFKRSAS
jgi:energy-coupling factor transporter ATP-binding protein EcfA2